MTTKTKVTSEARARVISSTRVSSKRRPMVRQKKSELSRVHSRNSRRKPRLASQTGKSRVARTKRSIQTIGRFSQSLMSDQA
ncbi:hypothetical protein D3C87_1968790 [compost metagenome]